MSDDKIPDDVMEMLPEFLQESEEHLQVLNEKMLEAEKTIKAGAQMSQADLNTMFRSAHTIKGTASFIGLKRVVALTHKAETLLQKLRDGEMPLSDKAVNVLFSAFDTLNNLLSSLRETKKEGVEIDAEVQKIDVVLNSGAAASSAPAAAKPAVAPATPMPPPSPPKPAPPKPAVQVESTEAAATKAADEKEIIEKYLEPFIIEAQQNVDNLDALFVTVEKEPSNSQTINEIFRIMHTLKGSAGLVNAKPISEVAHRMENVLQFFRTENKALPLEMVAILLQAMDALKAMVDSLKTTRRINYDTAPIIKVIDKSAIKVVLEMKVAAAKAPGISKPIAAVKEVQVDWSHLPDAQRELIRSEVDLGSDIFMIEGIIKAKESIKSMRLAMVTERLAKNGRVVASFPSMDELDASKIDVMFVILFCSGINESNIREVLMMDSLTVRTVEKADQEFIHLLIGDKAVGKQHVPETPKAQESVPEPAVAVQAAAASASKEDASKDSKGAAPVEISTVKIDSRKLDKLMNLSGELVIIRSQYARLAGLFNNDLVRQKDIVRVTERSTVLAADLAREMMPGSALTAKDIARSQKILNELKGSLQALADQVNHEQIVENIHALAETTSSLEKTASDLQAGVMQTRMVPVEGVFTRFKRIVRDISKDLNKEVILKIEGAETELDKKIVDGLGDPLTHMIRNAVDHGLEDKETREKLGKPIAGTIILKAAHKGNSICIEISDDGKGMDPEKIAAAAIRKGVITEDQALKMTDKEKLNIIFLPGFSMAQKVTGLSGRGVGMDVVRSMITSFNGVVDIDTKLGEGTRFVLKIPLTLAIIQALLIIIGGDVYALPIDSVTEIIKVPLKDIYSIDGNATVKLRNHALSLIELEKVIQTKPNQITEESYKRVVIVTDGESRLGVLVDALVGKDEIVIKSFTEHFSKVKGIIGASILADGNVALILDPGTIIKESR